jgi:hypothetical protein
VGKLLHECAGVLRAQTASVGLAEQGAELVVVRAGAPSCGQVLEHGERDAVARREVFQTGGPARSVHTCSLHDAARNAGFKLHPPSTGHVRTRHFCGPQTGVANQVREQWETRGLDRQARCSGR